MDQFEMSTEDAQELGLDEAQMAKITEKVTNFTAELKKNYDGKAHQNAQGILDGAARSVQELTGVEREQGEKIADFIKRASGDHVSTLKTELESAKGEYLEKLKNTKGNEGLSAELDGLKQKYDEAKQKLANFEEVSEKAGKYDTLQTEYNTMTEQVAFTNAKPSFPESVNPYEAKAKWAEFESSLKEGNHIKLIDGEGWAIDKDNEHKRTKISELVAKDEGIQAMLTGRQQTGTGATPKDILKVEGVPFDIPKGADKATIGKLIREHLSKEGVPVHDPSYSEKFSTLFSKIKSQQNG